MFCILNSVKSIESLIINEVSHVYIKILVFVSIREVDLYQQDDTALKEELTKTLNTHTTEQPVKQTKSQIHD